MTLKRSILFTLAGLLLAANIGRAEEHVQRLRSPATVKGVVGGEAHDSYVFRAHKGQIMIVQISWPLEHDPEQKQDHGYNHADFWIGKLPDFDGDGRVTFGKASNNGKRWIGTIPKTGNYYIMLALTPQRITRLGLWLDKIRFRCNDGAAHRSVQALKNWHHILQEVLGDGAFAEKSRRH